jgi:hypothetical protein
MELGGEKFVVQESILKCLQVKLSDLLYPPKESVRWGVKDLDMSELGVGHVRPSSQESELGTEQGRLGVSRGGAVVRSDMSSTRVRHV